MWIRPETRDQRPETRDQRRNSLLRSILSIASLAALQVATAHGDGIKIDGTGVNAPVKIVYDDSGNDL
ncbi:MAG: hypothetical protein LBB38_01030, partial [Puniceicoccales bacterium]|nr:hypothetical protein [Puniceicoccales bacterium]